MASALLARGTSVSRQLVLLVLLAAACVLGAGAALRSTEYDETYTRLVTSPVPRPQWPAEPFTPASAAIPGEARRQARTTASAESPSSRCASAKPLATGLGTVLAYGFAYTGGVALAGVKGSTGHCGRGTGEVTRRV